MLLTIEKVIILKSINLFSEISESDLLAVVTQLEDMEVGVGEEIIKQGDLGTSMYIVVRGEVEVEIDGKVISKLSEKSVFGELSALDPEPRSATVRTTKDSILFKIDSAVIYNLITEYSNVAKGIIKILCQRIRECN
jgi:CRP-like cAMP-binding protein